MSYVVIVRDPADDGEFRLPCASRDEAQLAAERVREAFRRRGHAHFVYRIVRWTREAA